MLLFSHELLHVFLYCFAVYTVSRTKRGLVTKKLFFVGLAATLLIDTDHFLDFFIAGGSDFFSGSYFAESGRIIVLLHSWEFVAILGGVSLLRKNRILLFVALGFFIHILMDAAYYRFPLGSYLLVNRILHNFAISVFN